MSKLSPHLPHRPGESPVSFLGRLANFHCVPNPRLLSRMVGLNFRRLAYGEPDELAMLAQIAGVPASGLREAAARRESDGWTLRNQRVGQLHDGLRRVCPLCLADDIAGSSQAPNAAAYGRTLWTLAPIATCLIHQVRLIDVGVPVTGVLSLEFNRPIQGALDDLPSLLDRTMHQVPSSLEAYLLQRLIGPAQTPCWLDQLEWWAAAETCQALGTVALFGRATYKNSLSPDDLHRAGAAGHDVAVLGAEAIVSFLRAEHRKNKDRPRTNYSSTMTLGTLHHWMVCRQARPSFEPICGLFREHLLTTRPYGKGAMVLGRPLAERRFHTVHSLAAELGVHYRAVQDHLVLHGVLTRDAITRDGSHLLIPVDEAEAVVSRYRDSLTLGEATALLGLGQRQGIRAAKEGLLQPIASRTQYGRMQPTYDRTGVEALRDRLLADARPVSDRDGDLVTMDTATRMTGISTYDLLRHILAGKFRGLRIDPTRPGVQGLLIPAKEVLGFLRRHSAFRLTRRQAARILHVEASAITRLLERGFMRQREQRAGQSYERNGPGLERESLLAFQKTYVSASDLATSYGVIHTQIIVGLRVFGLRPCFDPTEVEAYFYDRNACRRFIDSERRRPMDYDALVAACRKNSKNARTAAKAIHVVKRLREAFAQSPSDKGLRRG